MAQRPASSSSRGAPIAPTSHEQNFKATCPPAIKLKEGHVAQGQLSLARPGQLASSAAASTTSHRPGSGGAEEEGWQEGQEQLGKGRV